MSVLQACTPRQEVLETELDDAIFAASLGDLVKGTAKKVYADPRLFFQNTHPARALCAIARRVFHHLKEPSEGGLFVRLSTGFGGGKTHALMALWHLARNADDATVGAEVVPVAERPANVQVVAVDVGAAGIPNFGQHVLPSGETVTTHSLWAELAFLLAGKAGVDSLGEGEALDRQPNVDEFARLLPAGPALILLDELVIYMASLRENEQQNLLNFVNKLIGVCTNRPNTVLVISDPAAQAVYAQATSQLAAAIHEAAALKLGDVTGRAASDLDPIGEESSLVIVRRLFADIDQAAAEAAADGYHSLYARLRDDPAGRLVPEEAARDDYRTQIITSYPFHPRLMQTARDRLSSINEFNRSRGTLRLFARLVRNVWRRDSAIDLITAGEVDWADPSVVTELLARLNRDGFSGAVNTDIGQHAGELDSGADRGIHRRAASALLLESLTLEPNAGLDNQQLTLAVVRPEEAGTEAIDAMDRLMGECWYTYRLDSGNGYQFRVEPNVNQMIAQRAPLVPVEDALARVRTEVQAYFQGPVFKVVPWPANARQVPDDARLRLALCDTVELAKRVASLSNDEDPAAEAPRQFRNAVVAVAPAHDPFLHAQGIARRLIAAEDLLKEHQTGESGKHIREQLNPIVTSLRRELAIQARRAFSNVVLADKQVRQMEEKYLVSPEKEKILSSNVGQANLRAFLEEKKLIYQSSDRLDIDLFVTRVLTGATPWVQSPGAFTGKSVHERFLSAPELRLVPDEGVVRRTIIEAVAAGRLVVRLSDGAAYDAGGAVVGPEAQRERREGEQLPITFALTDETLVAPRDAPLVEEWLQVSDVQPSGGDGVTGGGGTTITPPVDTGRRTTSWEQAREWAATRPLKSLVLAAATPGAAGTLVPLAGPLGANRLSITVLCMGKGKATGGTFRLQIEGAPINHPTGPLNMATTIYNSLDEAAGRQFTVRLTLDFGPAGRTNMAAALEQAAAAAAEGVTMEAEFAPGSETQEALIS
jgi:hypothetical protein